MSNNGLFSLPSGWQWKQFGECARLINGRAYSQHELLDSGTPVLRIQNLNGGDRWYYSNLHLPEDKYCDSGDLLFAWSASFGPYRFFGPKSIFHYHIWRVIPSDILDKKFAYYLLEWITEKVKAAAHGVAMLHITKAGMEAWPVALPTLAEQRRIADVLDRAEALRAKRRAALAQLDTLPQSIFLDLFGDPVVNPKGWEVKKLGSIGSVDRGVSKHRPRNAPELLGGTYPLVQTGDIANCNGYVRGYQSTYSELGLRQSKLWPAGTLCITIAANIAKTGILTFDACFPDSVVGFRAGEPATVEYVRIWLSFLQKGLEDRAPESAQKNINLAILRDLRVPFAPLRLRQHFAAQISQIQKMRSSLALSSGRLDVLFGSLQTRAFRGELFSDRNLEAAVTAGSE